MANNWTTLGHDEKRTFTSDGDIPGALTHAWTYTAEMIGTELMGDRDWYASNMIATTYGIFFQYENKKIDYASSSRPFACVDRVTLDGNVGWQNQTLGANYNFGTHMCLAWGGIILSEDAYYFIDKVTGNSTMFEMRDCWGNPCTDPNDSSIIYATNKQFMDPPYEGIWVRAFRHNTATNRGIKLWQQNTFNPVVRPDGSREGANDGMQGVLSFENNTVYYAANYQYNNLLSTSNPPPKGIYAFDSATGTRKWYVAATPYTPISIGTYLYLMEETAGILNLVARSKLTGDVIWSQPIIGSNLGIVPPYYYGVMTTLTSLQCPVIVGSIVIVATTTGVYAYNQTTGAPVWANSTPPFNRTFNNRQLPHSHTIMAAASTSNTLVLCGQDAELHVIDLADGSEIWSGMPTVTPSKQLLNPVILGNMVYVSDQTGRFYAFQSGGAAPTLDTEDPVCTITTPTDNQTVSETISITATATDNVGISKIQLFVAGGLVGTCLSSPCTVSYNTKRLPNGGPYTITANAYDTSFNLGTDSVAVTVSNTVDSTAPVVTISSPTNGTTVYSRNTKKVNINVSATDNVAVSGISILIDGGVQKSCAGATCSYSWNISRVSKGSHTISAVATDTAGNQAQTTISITVA